MKEGLSLLLHTMVYETLHIVCIEVSTPLPPSPAPSQKHRPHRSCQAPPLKRQTVQAPSLFRQSPQHWLLVKPPPPQPLKVRFFSEPPK